MGSSVVVKPITKRRITHNKLQQIAFYDYFRINRIVKNVISR